MDEHVLSMQEAWLQSLASQTEIQGHLRSQMTELL
jgi:hypothetical protein